jgi:serine/threonine protein kinase/Tfp pilus assembly protein PilF
MAGSPLVSRPDADLLALVEPLAEEMVERWQRGERPLAEEYLGLHPEVCESPEAVLELISEEMHLRHEHGEELPPAEFTRRFPRLRQQVQALLSCHSLLAGHLATPSFPSAGESVGEFRLGPELGRGAHARVFLATQPALADRPVVLKVGPVAGLEHLSLARLQHSHIVPLYSVHDFPERGLRALCLPYFGGVTLARILEALRLRPLYERSGSDIVALLREPGAAEPTSPACRFLSRASYTQAVCWMGACLADALQYAQERGLVHLDLKPSNVLIASDGQPMLLDFHLARAPLAAAEKAPAWLGGTPGYMAPEQEAALAAVRERGTVPIAIDARTDIYALGILLYETLAGSMPGSGAPARSLRQTNPAVSAGLADIIGKCLAGEPAKRYQTAAGLAADLRRHLANLPLRQVSNRSLAERFEKWRRRHPYSFVVAGSLLALTAGIGLLFAQLDRQAERADAAVREGEQRLQDGRFADALESFRHAAVLVENAPFHADLKQQLRDGTLRAEQGEAIHDLHALAESIRPFYDAERLPAAQVGAAEEQCRRFWEARDLIGRRLVPHSDPALQAQVRQDLLDLAIVFANLHARAASANASAPSEAVEILAQAEHDLGPSCVLYQERSKHLRALGLGDAAEQAVSKAAKLSPQNAWEHYALGRAYFAAGDLDRAAREMEYALELDPQGLWPNFYKGACAYRRGRYADAVTAFSVCSALAPGSAWCLYNRGLAYMELKRSAEARGDLERARALDPSLAGAALARGILDYRERRLGEALHDLEQALALGMDAPAVYYEQALVHLARQDKVSARESVKHALRLDPQNLRAQELLSKIGGKP